MSKQSGVKKIDKGFKKIKKSFGKLDGSKTEVGFFDNSEYDDGTKIATVAYWNEYGTSRSPERSFFRSSISESQDRIANAKEKLYIAVSENRLTPEKAIQSLGELGQKIIKNKIVTLTTPPNSEITIKIKGSSNPLIDNGQMLNAVDHMDYTK